MKVEVLYRPSYSVAQVFLDQSEKIQVEAGAMLAMSADMEIKTEARGGFLKSISRSMFGGESFFMNTYTGAKDDDRLLLAPPYPATSPWSRCKVIPCWYNLAPTWLHQKVSRWTPALAALVTTFIYQRNVRGLGWGFGRPK